MEIQSFGFSYFVAVAVDETKKSIYSTVSSGGTGEGGGYELIAGCRRDVIGWQGM